jgi:hypothetical protein
MSAAIEPASQQVSQPEGLTVGAATAGAPCYIKILFISLTMMAGLVGVPCSNVQRTSRTDSGGLAVHLCAGGCSKCSALPSHVHTFVFCKGGDYLVDAVH